VIGLTFDPTMRRLMVAGVASRFSPTGTLGRGGPLALRRLPDPIAPGPDWKVVEPVWCGVCGSDVHQAFLDADISSPLSSIVAFPHVMGHEVVARDEEGRHVAINPWLDCELRGEMRCSACAHGHPPLCEHVLDGHGMHIGNMPRLPGGFGTKLIAHRNQLHPLAPGLGRAGVLADPLAVAWHAFERSAAEPARGPIVVLGAGTIGLSAAAVASWREPGARVVVTSPWGHSRIEAQAIGAIACEPDRIVEVVAGLTGEKPVRPWWGRKWLRRGAAAVIDTVGSPQTLEAALRVAGPRTRVVLVGVGRAGRFDPTLAYLKEVEVVGSNGYGRDAFAAAIQMLGAGHVPSARWLTHSFPLAEWSKAFATAREPGRNRSIKVVVEVSIDDDR
jgi:threonine dehydrogenase-like Zn-dependent dehydrogenase